MIKTLLFGSIALYAATQVIARSGRNLKYDVIAGQLYKFTISVKPALTEAQALGISNALTVLGATAVDIFSNPTNDGSVVTFTMRALATGAIEPDQLLFGLGIIGRLHEVRATEVRHLPSGAP